MTATVAWTFALEGSIMRHACGLLIAVFLILPSAALAQYDRPYKADETAKELNKRTNMVKWLSRKVKHITKRELAAFQAIKRHKFMKNKNQNIAYKNKWAGIGYGQTITSPWMVAYMTTLLNIRETDKVLEIGSGSGYQGSILSELTKNVYSVEIIKPLARRTHALLEKMGIKKKINHHIGDGYFGWSKHAPFDKIVVTCAADHIPVPLIQQLKPGGVMIIPVGAAFQTGNVYLVTKQKNGSIRRKVVATATFVPLRRTDKSKD
jgi:protein-L-isoaspartate(D-aspartate) O-methyltransferase